MMTISRIAVGAVAAALLSASASAQYTPLYSTGFNSASGFVAGDINAQNGWTTYDPSFTTGGGNFALITTAAPAGFEGDQALELNSGTSAASSPRYAWWAPGATGYSAAFAAAGGYELRVTTKMFRPSAGAPSTARLGVVTFDATGAKILTGFYVQQDTGIVYLLAYYNNGGTLGNYAFNTNVVLPPDVWTDVQMTWNKVTGRMEVFWGTNSFFVPGAGAGSLPDETDFYATRNNSTVARTCYFDALGIDAKGTAYAPCLSAVNACDVPSATGGCNTIGCCDTVCGVQSSCCDTAWDVSCVALAIPTCNLFVYSCTQPGTPPNNCATGPTVVSALPALIAYDTTSATTDGPPEANCFSGDNDLPIHKDVWYQVFAATGGSLVASNCGGSSYGGNGNFDSKIAAYDLGTTPVLDPQTLPEKFIGCDEFCGSDTSFDTSELVVLNNVQQGHYYLVRLGGWKASTASVGQSGTGVIYINIIPPPNPCNPANVITGVPGINTVISDPTYPTFATTTCAFAGSQNIYEAKFIKFTPAASGTITFQTCSDAGTTPATDSRLAAMTVCGDATTIIGCDDDGCVPGSTTIFTSKLQFTCTAGTTYYVAVGGYSTGWSGSNVEIIPPTAPACPADLNNDGQVNGADLGLLLGAWGPCAGCAADLNADGQVNGADLGLLLGAWGPCA